MCYSWHCSWSGLVCAEAQVYFADDRLKEAVEAELWIPDPTPEDMLGLTSLYAGDDGIIDLTGLEYATNLQTLELPNNDICDIAALSGLANLRVLSLRSNRISDISALAGLSNLEELDLFGNEVSDISALSSVGNLEILNLQRNEVSDVSPLSGLSRLRSLDLHRNQVSDISGLVELPSLEWLDLRINPLSEETYSSYIPQMLQNHPGMWLAYYPSMRRRLVLSSTAGGSVIHPGEGEFTWEHGEVVWLQAEAEPGFVFLNWSGSYSEPHSSLYLTMDDNFEMRANFLCTRDIIYVSNNALQGGDCPNVRGEQFPAGRDARASVRPDPGGDRSRCRRASIIVAPGVYRESIDFLGKGIRLIGMEVNEPNGATWPVIDGDGADTVVRFASGEDAQQHADRFHDHGRQSPVHRGNPMRRRQSDDCQLPDRGKPCHGSEWRRGILQGQPGGIHQLRDCRQPCRRQWRGLVSCESRVVVVNSVIWANAPTGITAEGVDPYVRFSDIAGGWPGRGNVDTDPLFVRTGPGWIAINPDVVVSPTNPDAVWIMGDYHLKSRAGRWDPASGLWVRDRTSSPCIDAGDPRSWVGDEPFPNGGIINMGVYGGTAQACKSYMPSIVPEWRGGR